MNSQYVLKTINPFVRDNKLTYDDFEKIFGFLPRKEQYSIADTIQDDLNIELVDELENLPEEVPPITNPAHEIRMSNKLLIRLVQDGDEQARQDLCVKNRGLVEKILSEHQKRVVTEDLVEKCNELLIKAAEEFTFDNEIDFDSYATQIMELALREGVD